MSLMLSAAVACRLKHAHRGTRRCHAQQLARACHLRVVPVGAVSDASPGRQGSASPLRALDHLRQRPTTSTYGDAAHLWSSPQTASELRCYFK